MLCQLLFGRRLGPVNIVARERRRAAPSGILI
jgi:hypothetical protein